MISYDRIIASSPFKFLVGRDKKPLTVHTALIAHHSKPLGILVNGHMSEAKEGYALLEDVNEQTFARFSQYAYTGDYDAAEPETFLESSVMDDAEAVADDFGGLAKIDVDFWGRGSNDSWGQGSNDSSAAEPALSVEEMGLSRAFKGLRKGWISRTERLNDGTLLFIGPNWQTIEVGYKQVVLCDSFALMNYGYWSPGFEPRKIQGACENYTNVFLTDAQIYVFADKYDIPALRTLSLHKLQRTLTVFVLYEKRIGDIVDLLSYSYANTADRSDTTDDLRVLVTHYAAGVVEKLAREEKFLSLLEEQGSFARDLMQQVLKRLH